MILCYVNTHVHNSTAVADMYWDWDKGETCLPFINTMQYAMGRIGPPMKPNINAIERIEI